MDHETRRGLVDRFKFGLCYPMAAALAERPGWSIRCLVVETRPGPNSPWNDHMVHAWGLNPDGQGFDAAGPIDDDTVTREYLAGTSREFRNVRFLDFNEETFLAELKRCFGRDEWWDEHLVLHFKMIAEAKEALDDGLLDDVEPESEAEEELTLPLPF